MSYMLHLEASITFKNLPVCQNLAEEESELSSVHSTAPYRLFLLQTVGSTSYVMYQMQSNNQKALSCL